jgi:hypothetical protein
MMSWARLPRRSWRVAGRQTASQASNAPSPPQQRLLGQLVVVSLASNLTPQPPLTTNKAKSKMESSKKQLNQQLVEAAGT